MEEKISMRERPLARTEGIISERVDGELVIYDKSNEMAHCLSADAAAVWSRCDGNSALEDVAQAIKRPIESVRLVVAQLAEAKLLQPDPRSTPHYSRREVAFRATKLGGVAIAAPLIYSVAVPPAAFAASGTAANGADQTPAQCPAASGAKTTDNQCASHTCYQASAFPNPRFCVPSTCAVSGATCSTFSDCCAGAYISNPLHTLVCQSGHCAA